MKFKSKHTRFSCYIGYITQGVSINLAPLLFTTFINEYGISLVGISALITCSFITQLLTDAATPYVIRRIGTRGSVVTAHAFAVFGLIGFSLFPEILPDAYSGLIIADIFCGIGGGMIEVLISPIIEACPSGNKTASMSMLHSFYCWGQAGVILLSTLFFATIGISHWQILTCLWALIPLVGAFLFSFVPIYELPEETDPEKRKKNTCFKNKLFWALFVMMLCSGAAEMTMSQWASTFAETGLNVNKSLGDLLGPCMFAILMGIGRLFYAFLSPKIKLHTALIFSCLLCVVSYLLASLVPDPIISLIGCALSGLSVSILWPGSISLASRSLPKGGISMFALLALAGDVGCLIGPSVAGNIASANNNDLKSAFLVSLIYPVLLCIMVFFLKKSKNEKQKGSDS